ncbi:glycine-rich domain-containing protein [Streptomyces sp. NPDC048392]|uniref:glycine-rich domain-containing protein n=1 Tax=Streptomyces sp. NPDC048392 TaxID=3365543 RepID=UPI003722BA4A
MLVTDAQFASVRSTVMDANPDMAEEMAGRIVDEGLKFVTACATHPGHGLAPSRIVDEGWHALILHTGMYAELCERLGGEGAFVHHSPGYDPTSYDPPILDRTRETIAALGWDAIRSCGGRRPTRLSSPWQRSAGTPRTAPSSSRPSRSPGRRGLPVKGGAVSEWIDPRYADLAKAWKRSQQPASRDPKEQRPVRGFVTPPKP